MLGTTSITPCVREQIWVLKCEAFLYMYNVCLCSSLSPVCEHVYLHVFMCDSLCMCVFAAQAMRDGHHQGSATIERGRSVKDLKPCSPTEEMDRLWCWCEQIKGSQNERNGPLSAMERPYRGTEPACFAPNQGEEGIEEDGERDRGECVSERKTHTKRLGERG